MNNSEYDQNEINDTNDTLLIFKAITTMIESHLKD